MNAPEEIDWPERWRRMVEARAAQVTRFRDGDAGDGYWQRRAGAYGKSHRLVDTADPVVTLVTSLATPGDTVLDVGAGTGRYALAIAPLVRRVVAVDPSAAMTEILAGAAYDLGLRNLEIVRDRWENVSLHADIVLCAHVLYPIPNIVPFIRSLQTAAGKACVLVLRTSSPESVLREAWLAIHGEAPHSDPAFIETYNVLWSLGIAANVRFLPHAEPWSFPSSAAALAWARDILWVPSAIGDTELWSRVELLMQREAGVFTLRAATPPTALVWWHTA